MSYTIKLPQFEGPFDLLLFFIERDELDIYNIPIAKLTHDFLDYLRQMEALNLDVASEFILVAASLMRIKAKMLLPRKELDDQGNEIDPREELVQRLIEYKRYKSVLDELRSLEIKRMQREKRGHASQELKKLATQALADAELENLSLYKLLKAYERVMQRFDYEQRRTVHTVVHYNYTLEERRDFILQTVRKYARPDFSTLFENCENRVHAIFTFLALLDLLQLEQIHIILGEGLNNFWLSPSTTE